MNVVTIMMINLLSKAGSLDHTPTSNSTPELATTSIPSPIEPKNFDVDVFVDIPLDDSVLELSQKNKIKPQDLPRLLVDSELLNKSVYGIKKFECILPLDSNKTLEQFDLKKASSTSAPFKTLEIAETIYQTNLKPIRINRPYYLIHRQIGIAPSKEISIQSMLNELLHQRPVRITFMRAKIILEPNSSHLALLKITQNSTYQIKTLAAFVKWWDDYGFLNQF